MDRQGQDCEQEAKTKWASVGPLTLRKDGLWAVGLGTREGPRAAWAGGLAQAWVAKEKDSHGGKSQAGTRL